MNFDSARIIRELDRNKDLIKNLLSGVPSHEYLWKMNNEKWCLLEIVCHLLDEEREDFRKRLKHILDNLNQDFDPIDPVGWVKKRNYLDKDYDKQLEMFFHERSQSVTWLKDLKTPNWNNSYDHPTIGIMTSEFMLSNWLAHDYLHIRQILKVKFDYLKHHTRESLAYAGEW